MERYIESGGAATAPTPASGATNNYPTQGNPATATPASVPGEWWFHQVTEELRAVITAAGLTPDHTNLGQLLAALQKLDVIGDVSIKSLTTAGYMKLPGGLIMQWLQVTVPASSYAAAVWPIAFPHALLGVFSGRQAAAAGGGGVFASSVPTTTGATFYNADASPASRTEYVLVIGY